MESVEKVEPKHKVTPSNWRAYSDHMHAKFMERMDIAQGSFEEAVFLCFEGGGEYGELMNVVKKMWRDGQSQELSEKLAKEVADVLIILDHFMKVFDLSATAVCTMKIQELTERWPDIFEDFQPQQTN